MGLSLGVMDAPAPAMAAPVFAVQTVPSLGQQTSPVRSAQSTIARTSCPPEEFLDNPQGSVAYTAVRWMQCNALSTGYRDGTYGKHRDITRGESVALMYRYLAPTPTASTFAFTDVPRGHSFHAPIQWAAASAVTVGYGDGTFRPSRRVSRGEFASFLHRASGGPSGATTAQRFPDVEEDSAHADAAAWMRVTGLSTGYQDGTYRPHRPISRSEVALILHRYHQTLGTPHLAPVAPTPGYAPIPEDTVQEIRSANDRWSVYTTAHQHLRTAPTSTHPTWGTVPVRAKLQVLGHADSGRWLRVHVPSLGRTGWIDQHSTDVPSYVNGSATGGRKVSVSEAYTTNRRGLTDRFWTASTTSRLYDSVGGTVMIEDIPQHSVVYRDIALERRGGQLDGWFYVRTQGLKGWMRTADLATVSRAATSNIEGYTRAQIVGQPNGAMPQGMLGALPWDPERTLVAKPAIPDLTRLNQAFTAQFGTPLTVDLGYRTLDTQHYFWRILGPYIAARPGTSNHGHGVAIDLPETREHAFGSAYYQWLKKNSCRYNLIHHDRLEQWSPYAEYWHFEWIPGHGCTLKDTTDGRQ